MSCSLNLNAAQNHAWDLARTLMAPVILFKVKEDEYGVLPADDLEDDEVEVLFEYDPYQGGMPAHSAGTALQPLASGRPQAKLRRGQHRLNLRP